MTTSKNNLKDTKPSAFGEPMTPAVPEFNANPVKAKEKKPPGEKKAGKGLPKGQATLKVVKRKRNDGGSEDEVESEVTGEDLSGEMEISASSVGDEYKPADAKVPK